MALVRKLKELSLERDAPHAEVDCTFSIVHDENGRRYLQLDTYGSSSRKMPGKKSQSLRPSPEAIEQLKAIFASKF